MEFAWSSDSNDYAIREGGSRIKIHKNFQEKSSLKIEYAVEGIHGGALVGEPCSPCVLCVVLGALLFLH
jgi:coatomer subunit beta'